jgi:hypothetical protein
VHVRVAAVLSGSRTDGKGKLQLLSYYDTAQYLDCFASAVLCLGLGR